MVIFYLPIWLQRNAQKLEYNLIGLKQQVSSAAFTHYETLLKLLICLKRNLKLLYISLGPFNV